jgi:hypothetical protein
MHMKLTLLKFEVEMTPVQIVTACMRTCISECVIAEERSRIS